MSELRTSALDHWRKNAKAIRKNVSRLVDILTIYNVRGAFSRIRL